MNNPTTRRRFLKSSGATAAAVAGSNLFFANSAKAQSKAVTLGSGEHTYEWVPFGTLPEGHNYGSATHGVAFDSTGLLYVTHYGTPGSIVVFDPEGKYVRHLGEQHMNGGHGVGHGIAIRIEDGQEFLYLSPSESNQAFTKMSLKGEIVWQKGRDDLHKDSGHYEGKASYRPTNISFSPDGNCYLGDGYGSGIIHRYTKDGKHINSFGGNGKEDGKFNTPHGQWLDNRDGTPKIAICDRANKRLQWFDLEGNFLKKLDGFLFPADIDIQGDTMLVPDLHARVTLLDKDNKVIVHLGDDEAWRAQVTGGTPNVRGNSALWTPGKFVHPHDAAFDKDGNIFVAEWVVGGRLTKLRKVG